MCSFASFVARVKDGYFEYKVYDLLSHGETRATHGIAPTRCIRPGAWVDAHYLPSGPMVNLNSEDDKDYTEELVARINKTWPTFERFIADMARRSLLRRTSKLIVWAHDPRTRRRIDKLIGETDKYEIMEVFHACSYSLDRNMLPWAYILQALIKAKHPAAWELAPCMLTEHTIELYAAKCRFPDDLVVYLLDRYPVSQIAYSDEWLRLAPCTPRVYPKYLLQLVVRPFEEYEVRKMLNGADWSTAKHQNVIFHAILDAVRKEYIEVLMKKIVPEFHTDLTRHVQRALNYGCRLSPRLLRILPYNPKKLLIGPHAIEALSVDSTNFLVQRGATFIRLTRYDLLQIGEDSSKKLANAIRRGLRVNELSENLLEIEQILRNRFGLNERLIRAFTAQAA